MNENDPQAGSEPRAANVIPFRAASRPNQGEENVERHVARLANEVGGTLLELVATADAHGLALPPALRQAALALDPAAHDMANRQALVWVDPALSLPCDAIPAHITSEASVNRIEFIQTVLGAAGGLVLQRFQAGEPVRLGEGDVARCRKNLEQLYALDDQYGGSPAVYGLTVRSARQMQRLLDQTVYDEKVGSDLLSITGEVTEHAGWLAYDAGRHAAARYWWLEAQHTAQLAGSHNVSTVVFASMALQASRQGRGQVTINTAQAAQRAAKPMQTPRLQSVLLAREALGHARTGDARRTWHMLRRADSLAGRERHDNDPPWLDFWGPADLAWHRILAAIDLEVLSIAEEAARDALGLVDSVAFPRNQALYLAHLADLLVTKKALDEAVPITAQAITSANEVESGRLHGQLQALLRRLSGYRGHEAVDQLLDWAPTVLRPSPVPA